MRRAVAFLEETAPSFNGRTADSGSAYRGSNPWGAAKMQFPVLLRALSFDPICMRWRLPIDNAAECVSIEFPPVDALQTG
jgi:hypothetical protein